MTSISIDEIIDRIMSGRTMPKTRVKYPCSICYKAVRNNQGAVQCDSCDLWVHNKCNGTTDKEYELLKLSDETQSWECIVCMLSKNLVTVPFTLCDNTELRNINSSNSMKFLESLPNAQTVIESTKFSKSTPSDINFEIPNNTNSKYYSVEEYQKEKKLGNFNIFHTNVNGLGSKYDNLHEFISSVPSKLDVIAITETSEKEEFGFLTNVEMEGYELFHTPSKISKGGTAVYVNNCFDSLVRNDINIISDEFESTWVEIKNKKSKNILVGCIYRHPHNNFKDFFQYLDETLSKLVKENKELYLCGDFNFDLSKIDTDHFTQHFFNLLCCYGFMPHILQPTRVTENTATVIDNIFSNNIEDEISSGNILITFSEHFSQFTSVCREKIDLKKLNILQRDYSTFSSESFRNDVSIQNWNYSLNNVDDSFQDFYRKLEGCVNRHAPMKKLTPREIQTKNKPWINEEIAKLIKLRNKAHARKKRQPNNVNCKRLNNLLRNRVQRELKKSKKQYYADYFAENVNNIKKKHGKVSGKLLTSRRCQ